MRRTPFIACTLALLALAPAAQAVGQLADISIYDRESRQTLPVYVHDGEYYVAGQPGNEYRIRVRNQVDGDLLAVVSVDGINVVTGETAHWRQGGYVLGGQQALDIDGWRKSLSRTAAFYFTRLPDSYAARTGRPDNVGVIGVALFQRRPEVVPMPQVLDAPGVGRERAEAERGVDGATPPAAAGARSAPRPAEDKSADSAMSPAQRLGTGHGRSETSPARYTTFERATEAPVEIIAIRYDSREHLVAMGILPEDRPRPLAVNPFPDHFVADPPH